MIQKRQVNLMSNIFKNMGIYKNPDEIYYQELDSAIMY